MNREILSKLNDILQNAEIRELISNKGLIPYQDYMTVRDYFEKKFEEVYLKDRLHDIQIEIKQYEGQ